MWMYIVFGSDSPRATVTGVEPFGVTQKSSCMPLA